MNKFFVFLDIVFINIEKNISMKKIRGTIEINLSLFEKSPLFNLGVYSYWSAKMISLIAFNVPNSYCFALKLGCIVNSIISWEILSVRLCLTLFPISILYELGYW